MWPTLFEFDVPGLGLVTVSGYAFFITVGLTLSVFVARGLADRCGLRREDAMDYGFLGLATFLVGGRLGYHLTGELPETLRDPLRIFEFWHGGFVFYGGAAGVILAALLHARLRGVPFLRLIDVWAPGAAAGMIFARVGCLAAGCCWGKPIDRPFGVELPWAITFYHGSVPAELKGIPLHPTQIYMSLGWVGITAYLLWRARRRRFEGELFATLLMLYAPMRFAVEVFRGDDIRGLWAFGVSSSQVLALPAFLVGLGVYRWAARRARRSHRYGLGMAEDLVERNRRAALLLEDARVSWRPASRS